MMVALVRLIWRTTTTEELMKSCALKDYDGHMVWVEECAREECAKSGKVYRQEPNNNN